MKQCIIVMGMHRSGTSAVTGVLNTLGLELGLDIMKPSAENPKGYFENQDINVLNEIILNRLNSSWHDVFFLQKDWWKYPGIIELREKAIKLIQVQFAGADKFCIKDPRICILFPFWKTIFESLDLRISFIIPVRNPMEVANSMRIRHGLGVQKGIILWMNHMLNAEFYSKNADRVFVSFNEMLKKPEKSLNRISLALRINFPKNWQEAESDLEKFIESDLKHFNYDDHALEKDFMPLVTNYYQLLIELCHVRRISEKKLLEIDKIREKYNKIHGLFYNQNLKEEISLKKQIDELEIRTQVYDKELARINELLKGKEGELLLVEEKLTEKTLKLQQAHIQLQDLQVQYEAKECLLNEIFASKGWLWLNRLRRIKKSLSLSNRPESRREGLTVERTPYKAKIHRSANAQRPKVIHAIGNLMIGGSTRLVVDLIEQLGHKYEQKVITNFVPSPPCYTGFPYYDFTGLHSVESLAEFLQGEKPEILHIHYWGEPWYTKIFKAAEKCSCTIIENINTPTPPFVADNIQQYVYVSRYAMNYAPAVEEKALVIYPGTDFYMFQRDAAPIPEDTIGMVYRLEEDKLREDSIQLFIDVVKKRPQTRVYIIGGGTLFDSYRNQVADQGVSENFIFTGYISYERLPDYYRKLSLFVAPVWCESFGQVSTFAMGMKIPVVGYDIGALSEILGSNDCLGKDPAELSSIIIDLLNDRQKRLRLGAANYARAKDLFSVENMIKSYDLLYSKLLK